MTNKAQILDKAPEELMLVDDVTGSGDPYNTATAPRSNFRACEFVRGGRTYKGDRDPRTSERPRYYKD